MDKGCLVSIVTSTFNSEKTVSKAIESVLNQTYGNIEYIVADGDSKDNTLQVVESYRDRFNERGIVLKVVTGKDSGIYGGMNKGIKLATGEIVGLVNSDDWYENNIVETIVEEYEKSKFDMCYCDVNMVDKDCNIMFVKKSKRMKHYFTSRKWNHPTTFIKKELYDIRMYDESFRYYADWDMMLWVFKNYNNIVVINKPLSNFRLGGTTTTTGFKTSRAKMKERYRAYRNNKFGCHYIVECFVMDVVKEIILRLKK